MYAIRGHKHPACCMKCYAVPLSLQQRQAAESHHTLSKHCLRQASVQCACPTWVYPSHEWGRPVQTVGWMAHGSQGKREIRPGPMLLAAGLCNRVR